MKKTYMSPEIQIIEFDGLELMSISGGVKAPELNIDYGGYVDEGLEPE